MRIDAARALAESLGDAVGDPLLVADEAGVLLFVNAPGLEAFGYSASEVEGRDAADLVSNWPSSPARNRLALPGRRRDGTSFPAEITIGRTTGGGHELVVAVVRDLTEQLRVVGELRHATEQLAESQRLARLGSWEWDIPSNDVTWSDELFRIYGLEPGSIVPSYESFLERVHPDDRASVEARGRKALAAHEPFCEVKRCMRPDGSTFLMSVQGEVIRDERGEPLRMVGVCEDVTAEKEAERATAELTSLVRSSVDAIVAFTPEGTITSWNPGATQLYGWEPEEMIGRPITATIPEELLPEHEEKVGRLARGETVEHFETVRRRQRREHRRRLARADGGPRLRRAAARDLGDRPRHQRAGADRGRAAAPGGPRLADRADQQAPVRRGAHRRGRGGLEQRRPRGRADARPRQLQVRQRRLRPPGRRRAAAQRRRAAGRRPRRRRPAGAARGRRVRAPAPRRRRGDHRAGARATLLETRARARRCRSTGGRSASPRASASSQFGRRRRQPARSCSPTRTGPCTWPRRRARPGDDVDGDERARQAETRLGWEYRIREALERDLFTLHCQPILDLRTGEVSQYELLLRMMGADGELIPPGAFLGVAERFGLIQAIDRWVVAEAIAMLAEARGPAARGQPLRALARRPPAARADQRRA